MRGRKSCTPEEIERGKAAVDQQLAAYRKLVEAVAGATGTAISIPPASASKRSSSTT